MPHDRLRRLRPRPLCRWLLVGAVALLAAIPSGDAPAQSATKIAKRTDVATDSQGSPLGQAIRIAQTSRETLRGVKDYEATFLKQELLDGALQSQAMRIKLREQPFSVYLRFEEPNAGREVIYVDGRNGGKLLVHEVGLKSVVGTLALSPKSSQVMAENRHPINEIGLAKMLELVIQQWENDAKLGNVQVKYYPDAKIGNLECRVIETRHAAPRGDVVFGMTRLYLDRQSGLPIRVQQYGFPKHPGGEPPLIEEYTYLNLKTNVGLKDLDFDSRNKDYGF